MRHFRLLALHAAAAFASLAFRAEAQVSYFLPRADLDISVTRVLTRCEFDTVAGQPAIGVRVAAEIKPVVSADSGTLQTVEVSALRRWNKKADVKLQLSAAGTLKAVNADYGDRTSEIITGVLGGALKIAAIGLGAPLGGLKPFAVPAEPQPCTADARAALEQKQAFGKQIDGAQRALQDARTALVATQPGSTEYQRLTRATEVLEKQLADYKASIDELTAFLTSKTTYRLRPETSTGASIPLTYPPSLPARWFALDTVAKPEVLKRLTASARLYGEKCSSACDPSSRPGEPEVRYRVPAVLTVRVCRSAACPDSPAHDNFDVIATQLVSVPQLGATRALPLLTKSWFSDQVLKAEFADDGSLLNFQYVANASAEKAAQTFSQSMDAVLKYEDYKRAAPTEKAKQETELLKALKDKVEAERALQEAIEPQP
jgi:hypothetical protein